MSSSSLNNRPPSVEGDAQLAPKLHEEEIKEERAQGSSSNNSNPFTQPSQPSSTTAAAPGTAAGQPTFAAPPSYGNQPTNVPYYGGYALPQYTNYVQGYSVPGYNPQQPGQPAAGQQVPTMPPGTHQITMMQVPVIQLGESEERILTTYSLGRGIRVLSIIDGIFLLINVFAFGSKGFYLLAFAFGPLAGFLSASQYSPNLAMLYFAYYICRIIWDIFVVAYFNVWWFIVSAVIDIFICRFVGSFIYLLKQCTPEELSLLRNPQQLRDRAQPYFMAF